MATHPAPLQPSIVRKMVRPNLLGKVKRLPWPFPSQYNALPAGLTTPNTRGNQTPAGKASLPASGGFYRGVGHGRKLITVRLGGLPGWKVLTLSSLHTRTHGHSLVQGPLAKAVSEETLMAEKGPGITRSQRLWLAVCLSKSTEQAQKLTWLVSWILGDLSGLTFTHPMPTDNMHSSISGKVPDSCTDFTSTWTRRDCPCSTERFDNTRSASWFSKSGLERPLQPDVEKCSWFWRHSSIS